MADMFAPTIEDAITELKRELKMREYVYPRFVSEGKLTESNSSLRMARLNLAISLLEERK